VASPQSVLLTGAAGFVGSQLARRLLVEEGDRVSAILRPETDRSRIAAIEPDLAIIDGDLRALPELTARLRAAHPDI
jgi:nucleoside-diphosphate-sugar epimerase